MIWMKRYAVYYAPRPGPFAERAAGWLGWDAAIGMHVTQPRLAPLPLPLANLTAEPRRYGFHGTLRAPFRLAAGVGEDDLHQHLAGMVRGLGRVTLDGLALHNLDGFLALTPTGKDESLQNLARRVVEATDPLRAPLSTDDIARRRPETLSPRQREYLMRWGYPHVMELFQFHLTLTGRLAPDHARQVMPVAQDYFDPVLPKPFAVDDICLFGEDDLGRFHLMERYALFC
jgi:putative phosphonate metabolism protein